MATGYLRSLLGEDEYETAQQSAFNNALLMAGLQGLISSGPSLTPTSTGQIIGQAGMAGLKGYQGAMQQAEQQALSGMDLAQMRQEQEANQAFNAALPEIFKGGKIDYPALQKLALVYPDRVGQVMQAYQSAQPPRPAAPKTSFREIFNDQGQKVTVLVNDRTGEIIRQLGGAAPSEQTFTGNFANIALSKYGTSDVSRLTPEQREDVQNIYNQQTQMSAQAGAPVVNVKYGEGFGTKLAGNQAQMIQDSFTQAQSAASTLDTVSRMMPLVNEAFTGPGSTAQTALAQVGEKLGVGGSRQDQLVSTAGLIKGAAQLELDAASALRGQGQITENERAMLRKAASFDPTTTTATEIQEILNTINKVAAKRMSSHNTTLDKFIETQDPAIRQQLELYRVSPPVPVRRK